MNCYVYADGTFYRDKLRGPIVDLGPNKELLKIGLVTLHFVGSNRLCFYLDGKRHREDGPAIVYINNPKMNEWWFHNHQILANNIEEFNKLIKLKAFW